MVARFGNLPTVERRRATGKLAAAMATGPGALVAAARTEIVIINRYHGAYRANCSAAGAVAVPNMSKLYRLRHAPVICDVNAWQRYAPLARAIPTRLMSAAKRAARFKAR